MGGVAGGRVPEVCAVCAVAVMLRVKARCVERTRENGESPWRHSSVYVCQEVPTEVYLREATCKISL